MMSTEEFWGDGGFFERYQYSLTGPLGRFWMNWDRRKRGLPPLRPLN